MCAHVSINLKQNLLLHTRFLSNLCQSFRVDFSLSSHFQIFANRFESIFLYLLNFKSLPIFSSRFFSIFSLSNLSIVSLAQKYKFSNCKKFNSNWFDYDFFIPSHFQIFVNYFNRFRSGNFPIVKSLFRVDSITIFSYFLTSKSLPIVSSRFHYDSSISSHFQIFANYFIRFKSGNFRIVKSLIRVDSTMIPSYLLSFKSLPIVSNRFNYDSSIPSHFQIFVNRFIRFKSRNFRIVKSLIRVDSTTIPSYLFISKFLPIVSSQFDYDSSLSSNFQIFVNFTSTGAEIFEL